MDALPLPETLFTVAMLAAAAFFKPLQMLRGSALQHPWLAALVLLPWGWSAAGLSPGGAAIQVSGACLLVLMVGW
nr:hypothetical protein [Rubrivivax sp.]